MESNLLLKTLQQKRIEIKYVIITLVVAGLILVSGSLFDGVEDRVNELMNDLADYGAVGMFLISLPANTTLVIQIPYNLPMFSILVYADSVWEVVWIGAATGLGAGIGEVMSYAVAHAILAAVDDLERSPLFRWTRSAIERRPGLIPYLVWAASATPVPDLVLIVPVAMVKYPWQKMILPMLIGKIMQNGALALIFYYATDRTAGSSSGSINFDLAAILVFLFVLIIAYQIEKSRAEKNASVETLDT